MTRAELPDDLRDEARTAWHRYLDLVAPLRPQLHRYCRRLTADIWDAEDLVQDTILRGFGALGSVHQRIDNPTAYLTRIATNLWTDTVRRRRTEAALLSETRSNDEGYTPADPAEVRDATTVLFGLSPHERAAVLMKDVFDMSLKEIAEVLGTSVNAVKASLHRGRGRLDEEPEGARVNRPVSAALVDRFVERLNASDLQGMLSLMLDTASVEMPGALLEVGREQFERQGSWFWQAVHVHPEMPVGTRPPKFVNECAIFRQEPVMLGFVLAADRKLLACVTRFEEVDAHISKIRAYQFSPETVHEVGEVLGFDVVPLPYRFPTPAPGKYWA